MLPYDTLDSVEHGPRTVEPRSRPQLVTCEKTCAHAVTNKQKRCFAFPHASHPGDLPSRRFTNPMHPCRHEGSCKKDQARKPPACVLCGNVPACRSRDTKVLSSVECAPLFADASGGLRVCMQGVCTQGVYNDDMRGLPVTRLALEVTDSLSNIFTVMYRSALVRQGAAIFFFLVPMQHR